MKQYYIYILTNQYNTIFYVGVTNNNKLVYYEVFSDVRDAIYREKQIKSWNRKKKMEMIEKFNPEWKDLYEEIIW